MYFYSKSTGGFYLSSIHGDNMPSDVVAVSDGNYTALMEAQRNGANIIASATGAPIALATEITLDLTMKYKLTELAAYRYQIETGGIMVNGNEISTDRETQSMLTGAWVTVQANPTILIDWKCDNGWTQIGKATVDALAAAVAAHIQACFSTEKGHSDAISSLTTIDEITAYDFTTGWPE